MEYFKKLLRCSAIVALVALVSFSLVSCDDDGSGETGLLTGKWASAYSDGIFFDTENDMFYIAYDFDSDGSIDWDTEVYLSGEIAKHDDYDAATGYLIIKVDTDTNETYGVGSYTALHWKECDGSTMLESTAYKSGATNSYATADEASANLTVDNGYYAWYGTYTKE